MTTIKRDPLDKSVKAAVFLASALGSLECLLAEEPKKHTRRAKRLLKTIDGMNQLLGMYEHSEDYDLMALGLHLFDLLESEANKALEKGFASKSDEKHTGGYIVVRQYSGPNAANVLWQVMSEPFSNELDAENAMVELSSIDKQRKPFQVVKVNYKGEPK